MKEVKLKKYLGTNISDDLKMKQTSLKYQIKVWEVSTKL